MPAPHEILGIPADAAPDAIRAAYSAKVKADHPDHGGAGHGILALKEARDQMLGRAPKPVDATCKVCRGTGWVKTGGFRPERCPRDC